MLNKKTKKLIVAYNPDKPDSRTTNFIVPLNIDGKRTFISIKNGKPADYGLVVFVGKDVMANHIFEKLKSLNVDGVEDGLLQIEAYIDSVSRLKIGDIVTMNKNGELVVMTKL